MKRILRALGLMAAGVALTGIVLLTLGGFHDLSAIRQHPQWVYRLIAIGREALVGWDARQTELPAGFVAQADARTAKLFQQHCAQCHGGPGVAPASFALGMMPAAPPLTGIDRRPGEVLWFIRNGLKMSGMPAWEGRLPDDQMLGLTGFVMALPTMTPARYRDLAGLDQPRPEPAPDVPRPGELIPGDPNRGVLAIQVHACRTCHVIPGIPGATDLRVGPPLALAGARRYIAGTLPNRPENMIRWLMAPQHVDPLSAMPDVGLTRQQAADIAAYLYELSEPPIRVAP